MTPYEEFILTFSNPPEQGSVGLPPKNYFQWLCDTCEYPPGNLNKFPRHDEKIDRCQLRKICSDKSIDDLVLYAAIMAWGGRNKRNFLLSLQEESRSNLVKVVNYLRNSNESRLVDFRETQHLCDGVKGLGISYYTKLMFFLRKKDDAYVLDQFTAKSAILLFENCDLNINSGQFPHPKTTPASYDKFCASIESLALKLGRNWSPSDVEVAMFGKSTPWRKFLNARWNPVNPSKEFKHSKSGDLPSLKRKQNLAELIIKTHVEKVSKGWHLPKSPEKIPQNKPVRLHCCSFKGVNWQYTINDNSVHAEVFFDNDNRKTYKSLCDKLLINDDFFGSDINGNGFKNGKTASIKATLFTGASSQDLEEVAVNAVCRMKNLFHIIVEEGS